MNKPKADLRVVKETFGTMDKQEAFQKAFEPYFNGERKPLKIPKRLDMDSK